MCTKAQAIRDVASWKSKSEVAKSLGVPRTTLNNWLKDQDKILRAVDQAQFSSQMKRMCTAILTNVCSDGFEKPAHRTFPSMVDC